MPIYEYKCNSCGTKIEKIQKFSDPLLKTCEACGGTLEKLWSLSGLQFKGTGWYVTDYARKTTNGKPSEETSKSGETSKTAETAKAACGSCDCN
ncbi:MAG: zinc ribbon domain-containing protein [Acidobacteria bacterium]|jgi:putative FmdB family regulatory protein|nr:MAG: zinc ribbon domain-containing protein [Acidobacteriota bacterium]GIU82058.1 MAG: FmdB family transcriptional regulator [Pyrinomonadaceae bacterium]